MFVVALIMGMKRGQLIPGPQHWYHNHKRMKLRYKVEVGKTVGHGV
jgi:hypothetical protein